ncbi:MAG: hypothetical protein AAFZ65_07055 [Planctomycetota bacterium]
MQLHATRTALLNLKDAVRLGFRTALVGLCLTPSLAAQEFAGDGAPLQFGFVGFPQDVPIPAVDPPNHIRLDVKGGGGGNAKILACEEAPGGRGARAFAYFKIGFGENDLRPGGTLRFIVGQRGFDSSFTTVDTLILSQARGGEAAGPVCCTAPTLALRGNPSWSLAAAVAGSRTRPCSSVAAVSPVSRRP